MIATLRLTLGALLRFCVGWPALVLSIGLTAFADRVNVLAARIDGADPCESKR